MKKSASKDTPPSARTTLFDRYREAGLADRLVNEMERRLKKQKRRRRAALRTSAGLLVVIGGLSWAVPYFRDTATISAPVATQKTITLADGSQAELNANSEIETDFRYGRRIVHLTRGEGFFSVTHNSERPFLVETFAGTIRVTGTHFNVRLTLTGRTEITLIEGQVTAAPSTAALGTVQLQPGQQTILAGAPPVVRTLTGRDMERSLAWRQGKIVLDGLLLADAAARFAEYHGCVITVDPAVAQVHLGGTYSLKNLPLFLDALKATGSVRVFTTGEGSYRISSL